MEYVRLVRNAGQVVLLRDEQQLAVGGRPHTSWGVPVSKHAQSRTYVSSATMHYVNYAAYVLRAQLSRSLTD